MLGLNQDTIDLVLVIAVAFAVPVLGVVIAAGLNRQIKRFGFSHSWGDNARDIKLNDF